MTTIIVVGIAITTLVIVPFVLSFFDDDDYDNSH